MLFTQDIGIDLGTSFTSVCVKGKGVVFREPSVVAVDVTAQEKKVVAVGKAAKDMIGRTPGSVVAVKPIRDGVIADYSITTEMLRVMIKKALGNTYFSRARLMISIPSGVTEVERRAVHMAARDAGARYVSLIESPMAAAIGAKLPINETRGSMVVDIGGGSTEIAVLSMGDIVMSNAVRVAGDHLDEGIIDYLKARHSLLIGERTAEDIKIKIGSAYHYDGEAALDVRGRNLQDGLPRNIEITSEEIREALYEKVQQIARAVKTALEKTPPELVSDILDRGIVLTGAGAQLRSLDRLLRAELKMPVALAAEPSKCVINGILFCLQSNSLEKL